MSDFLIEVNHTNSIAFPFYWKLYENKIATDCVLDVNGEIYHAHKVVLSCRSKKVFSLLKTSNKLTISDCQTAVFQAWIKYIYGFRIPFQQNLDIAENLVIFSETYGPVGLKEDYFEYLSNSYTYTDAINFIGSALKKKSIPFECHLMLRKCLEIIEPVAYDHIKNPNLLYLDEALLIDFLSCMNLAIDEFALFNFLLEWGQEAVKRKLYTNMVEAIRPFLGLIRFPLMTSEELNGRVRKSEVVPEHLLQNALNFTEQHKGDKSVGTGRELLGFNRISEFESQYLPRSSIIFTSFLNPRQYFHIIKWVGTKYLCHSACQKIKMIYNAKRDGWKASDFHKYCDNMGPTIVVCKTDNGNIFGGFAASDWHGDNHYENNPDCLLFSLVNSSGIPQTCPIIVSNNTYAMYCLSTYGPTFGGGFDLYICSEANKYSYSYSNIGNTYKAPLGTSYGKPNAKNFLAGSDNFILKELEVFALNPPLISK